MKILTKNQDENHIPEVKANAITIRGSAITWKVRYSVLLVLWLGWLMSFLDRMVISISLPFIGRDFHVDTIAQGFILSAFFAGYALFQIPGGLLADKVGFRRLLSIGITWWSIFTSMTGFVLSYPMMLVVRALFGLGEGCFPGASYKAIATYFPPKERGTATALQSTVNTLGPAVASVVAAIIISAFGWRYVFMFLGIPGVFIGLFIWRKFKDNPADHPKMTASELAEINGNSKDSERDTSPKVSLKEYIKKPIIWQMLLIWFFFDITFWGFVNWLPSYLMNVRGFSLMKTGIFGALPYLVGTVSMVLAGYISDRLRGMRKWMYIPNALIAGIFLYLTFKAPSASMSILYQCIAAFFMFWAQGAFWGLVVDSMPASIMGASSGMVNFGGQVAGIISPIVMGYLIQASHGSYDKAFIFIIAALVASALVALTVHPNIA